MRQHFAGSNLDASWGQRRDQAVPNPAAGADWTFRFTAGAWYRVLLATWTLTTSAQVANRSPSLQLLDGDGLVRFQSVDPLALVASKAAIVSAGVGMPTTSGGSGLAATIGMPDILIPAGWSLASTTAAIQTEDQASAIRLLVEELIDDYPAQAAGHDHHLRRTERIEVDVHAT